MKLNLKKQRVTVRGVLFELDKLRQPDFTLLLGHAVRLNGGSFMDIGQAFPKLVTDSIAMADVMAILKQHVKIVSGLVVVTADGERPGTYDDLALSGGVEGLGVLAELLPHLLMDNSLTEADAKN